MLQTWTAKADLANQIVGSVSNSAVHFVAKYHCIGNYNNYDNYDNLSNVP